MDGEPRYVFELPLEEQPDVIAHYHEVDQQNVEELLRSAERGVVPLDLSAEEVDLHVEKIAKPFNVPAGALPRTREALERLTLGKPPIRFY